MRPKLKVRLLFVLGKLVFKVIIVCFTGIFLVLPVRHVYAQFTDGDLTNSLGKDTRTGSWKE